MSNVKKLLLVYVVLAILSACKKMLDARRFQSIEIKSLLVQMTNLNTENNDADDVFLHALCGIFFFVAYNQIKIVFQRQVAILITIMIHTSLLRFVSMRNVFKIETFFV